MKNMTEIMHTAVPILRMIAEIGILFLVIYGVLYYLRSTRGSFILFGAVAMWLGFSLAANLLQMKVIERLLDITGNALLVVLAILFQPELRRLLAQLGSYTFWQGRRRREMIGEIVTAVCNMAGRKCGALIVIERRIHLQALADDAVVLDDKVNSLLLESIFYPNSPLHDGAVVIRGDRMIAARAILPLTRSKEVSPQLGTRHRAALGISEESDAVVVVVSEETGTISIARRGVLHRDIDGDCLRRMLEKLLIGDDDEFLEIEKMRNEESTSAHETARPAEEEGDKE